MIQFLYVMFDWGDTIMKDDRSMNMPMYKWPKVEVIEGAEDTLKILHKESKIFMATGATESNESDIRSALKRVKINNYFDRIYCVKNTGYRKPSEEFYRYVLKDQNITPSEIVMIGDNFDGDILGANKVGIEGIWLNMESNEVKEGNLFRTIFSLRELLTI